MGLFVTKTQICGGKKLRAKYGVGTGRVIPQGTVIELDRQQAENLAAWIEPYDPKNPPEDPAVAAKRAAKSSDPKPKSEKAEKAAK